MGNKPDPLWRHTPGAWLLDMGMQLALALVFGLVALWRLGRLSPGRRR
jgi:ABC transport system ATP-binding/permease protein